MLFSKSEENPNELPEASDQQHWEALLRGQVLSVTTQKFFNYINLADQKAQAMIILNSILIPVAIGKIDDPVFDVPATIAIIAAVGSILARIACIYPKRRSGRKPDGTYNLLHFGDIGRMREDQFLNLFCPVFNDLGELAEASIKDLHDISKRIILPKFFWLKIAYGFFFVGNLIAIGWTMYVIWFGS